MAHGRSDDRAGIRRWMLSDIGTGDEVEVVALDDVLAALAPSSGIPYGALCGKYPNDVIREALAAPLARSDEGSDA